MSMSVGLIVVALTGADATEIPSPLARVVEAADAKFQPAIGTLPVFRVPEAITKANQKWLELFAGALLDRGEIKTARKGRVVLELADRSALRLGPNSNLSLEQLRHEQQSGRTELELRAGELSCHPAERTAKDRALVVRTPAVIVTAEGRSFSIRQVPKKEVTTVQAIEGSVRVERREGGAVRPLSAGQQIAVSKDATGLPTPESIDNRP